MAKGRAVALETGMKGRGLDYFWRLVWAGGGSKFGNNYQEYIHRTCRCLVNNNTVPIPRLVAIEPKMPRYRHDDGLHSLHSLGSRLLRMRTFWLGVLKSDVQLTVL